MKPAGKQELASDHLRRHDPVGHSFSRVFRKLKLHGLVGFALNDGHSFAYSGIPEKVRNLQCDQVAAA